MAFERHSDIMDHSLRNKNKCIETNIQTGPITRIFMKISYNDYYIVKTSLFIRYV